MHDALIVWISRSSFVHALLRLCAFCVTVVVVFRVGWWQRPARKSQSFQRVSEQSAGFRLEVVVSCLFSDGQRGRSHRQCNDSDDAVGDDAPK